MKGKGEKVQGAWCMMVWLTGVNLLTLFTFNEKPKSAIL